MFLLKLILRSNTWTEHFLSSDLWNAWMYDLWMRKCTDFNRTCIFIRLPSKIIKTIWRLLCVCVMYPCFVSILSFRAKKTTTLENVEQVIVVWTLEYRYRSRCWYKKMFNRINIVLRLITQGVVLHGNGVYIMRR